MTKTKTYEKTNRNTKTHRHRQGQIQSIFQKQRDQGFIILYWDMVDQCLKKVPKKADLPLKSQSFFSLFL